MTNLKPFLDMIAHSEGTSQIPGGDDGYKVLVGSTVTVPSLFQSYADHPRTLVWLPRLKVSSTAAGRYQIKASIFDAYKAQLRLPDFSPASQNAIAIQLIRECHALALIEEGDFAAAVRACNSRWASLPNAGYGQHQNTLEDLRAAYEKAGGVSLAA